jgi:hypothetical protein
VGANLRAIRRAFCQRAYLFTTSGLPKMRKLGIGVRDIEEAICHDSPEIIEDYPSDARGPACLVFGVADLARPLHIVVGYGHIPGAVIEVVTVYEPDVSQWINHRVRRTR